jgi:hypothetical protein
LKEFLRQKFIFPFRFCFSLQDEILLFQVASPSDIAVRELLSGSIDLFSEEVSAATSSTLTAVEGVNYVGKCVQFKP